VKQIPERRLSSPGRLPSDIDGDETGPIVCPPDPPAGWPNTDDDRPYNQALHVLQTALARLQEVARMPAILQRAAYSAICIDLKDCIEEIKDSHG
jgi:hypothetical protein